MHAQCKGSPMVPWMAPSEVFLFNTFKKSPWSRVGDWNGVGSLLKLVVAILQKHIISVS